MKYFKFMVLNYFLEDLYDMLIARVPFSPIRRVIVQKNSNKRLFSSSVNDFIGLLTDSMHSLHSFSGLPWWALIPLTTIALRTVWTLPLAIAQRKRIQKQTNLRPIINAMNPVFKLNIARKITTMKAKQQDSLKSRKESGRINPAVENLLIKQAPLVNMSYEEIVLLTAKETRKRQKELFKREGVQLWKNTALPAFQIPLWISMSLMFRNLSGWHTLDDVANKALDPTLYTGGTLWFQDLSVSDPTHIFPFILGIISLCNVEWTFKTLELHRPQARTLRPTLIDSLSNISRMSIVFLMAVSLHAPVALTLYWISSQFFSLFQNIILDIMIPISYTPKTRLDITKLKDSSDRISLVKEPKVKSLP